MWRSLLFRRFFTIFAALIFCSSLLLITLFSARLETLVTQQVRQRMENTIALISSRAHVFLMSPTSSNFPDELNELSSKIEVRIRVYDSKKRLVGDSLPSTAPPKEISTAGKGLLEIEGLDATSVASQEFGKGLILYKQKLGAPDSPDGYILASLPRSTYEAELSTAKIFVITIVISTAVVALFATYLLVSRIVRSLATLEEGTQKLSEGDFDHEINVHSRDELESLADRFTA